MNQFILAFSNLKSDTEEVSEVVEMKFKFNAIIKISAAILGITFGSPVVLAAEVFTVNPYIIVNDNNKIQMNFSTNKDVKLDIAIEVKNKNTLKVQNINFSQAYKTAELNKLDLGTLSCDNVLSYRFMSAGTSLDVDRGLYAIPCNKSEPLYFGFLSDTQIKDQNGQQRADSLSTTVDSLRNLYPFSLIINAGDIVQHGGREEEWLNFFSTAKIYLNQSYLMAAVGNHEYYDSPMYEKAPPQFLNYMRNYTSAELGYAALDLGRISILMINSNFDFMSEGKIKEQWDWLEAKLKENQKINKPVIVTMHHSPFSSSAEWVREIPTRLRAELVPMLEKYSVVKMMISGHLHMYERSQKNGITYLIAGPSGGINNYITYNNPYKVFIKSQVTTFSVFKLNEKNIDVTTFTGTKEMLEHFTIDL